MGLEEGAAAWVAGSEGAQPRRARGVRGRKRRVVGVVGRADGEAVQQALWYEDDSALRRAGAQQYTGRVDVTRVVRARRGRVGHDCAEVAQLRVAHQRPRAQAEQVLYGGRVAEGHAAVRRHAVAVRHAEVRGEVELEDDEQDVRRRVLQREQLGR